MLEGVASRNTIKECITFKFGKVLENNITKMVGVYVVKENQKPEDQEEGAGEDKRPFRG